MVTSLTPTERPTRITRSCCLSLALCAYFCCRYRGLFHFQAWPLISNCAWLYERMDKQLVLTSRIMSHTDVKAKTFTFPFTMNLISLFFCHLKCWFDWAFSPLRSCMIKFMPWWHTPDLLDKRFTKRPSNLAKLDLLTSLFCTLCSVTRWFWVFSQQCSLVLWSVCTLLCVRDFEQICRLRPD